MQKKILVKAQPGEKCPCEDNPRTYITDAAQGTAVADSAYYRRLIADGSLVIVEPPSPAQAKEKAKGGDQ